MAHKLELTWHNFHASIPAMTFLALSSNGIQKYWKYFENEDHRNEKTTERFPNNGCKWLEILNIPISIGMERKISTSIIHSSTGIFQPGRMTRKMKCWKLQKGELNNFIEKVMSIEVHTMGKIWKCCVLCNKPFRKMNFLRNVIVVLLQGCLAVQNYYNSVKLLHVSPTLRSIFVTW